MKSAAIILAILICHLGERVVGECAQLPEATDNCENTEAIFVNTLALSSISNYLLTIHFKEFMWIFWKAHTALSITIQGIQGSNKR